MWSSIGSLKQRVSAIFKISHSGLEGKKLHLHTLCSPLLGLQDIAVECNGRPRKIASLSFLFCDIKRGISSSSTLVSSSPSGNGDDSKTKNKDGAKETQLESISFSEAKRIMRLVDVESLKMKLGMDGKEVITYSELLQTCQNMGVAKSPSEAIAFARVLDEAGVVLLFRDKVYLHPDKVRT